MEKALRFIGILSLRILSSCIEIRDKRVYFNLLEKPHLFYSLHFGIILPIIEIESIYPVKINFSGYEPLVDLFKHLIYRIKPEKKTTKEKVIFFIFKHKKLIEQTILILIFLFLLINLILLILNRLKTIFKSINKIVNQKD